ncbi:glycosyltransferase [Methylobacterium sp. B1]|uniref:glycosyltransferase family 2 protein n=1 Tax=Methylobacterium sp. B1 TaxID=91459 RepID=UPI001651A489|nr:glycosyltransferase [Methylobacterium sp. B1]
MDHTDQNEDNSTFAADIFDGDVTDVCGRYFDYTWYIAKHGNLTGSPDTILAHYLKQRGAEGFDPHPLFASSWYLNRNPDVAEAGLDPFFHFLKYGGAEGRDPHPAFDAKLYIRRHPGFEAEFNNPWIHYLNHDNLLGERCDAIAEWYRNVGADDDHTAARIAAETKPVNANKIVARANTALVYLARSIDGSPADFKRFLISYHKFAAGLDHDLIIIRKGEARAPGARRAIEATLIGMPVQYIDIPDDGYDIQAYFHAAKLLTHEFVCFLNTHSEILVDDWLLKLQRPFTDPTVGVTAATASYESIQDSIMSHDKVMWMLHTERRLDLDVEAFFASRIDRWFPQKSKISERQDAVRRLIDEGMIDESVVELDDILAYRHHWANTISAEGSLSGYEIFDVKFPSPHIRSTGFMMRRAVLLDLGFELSNDRTDCMLFESGRSSLCARLARRSLKPILVGADGRAFETERWPESGTFRLGDQANVMISDNRVREFMEADDGEREILATFSWGEYRGPVPTGLRKLGHPFARGDLHPWDRLRPLARPGAPEAAARPSISVVIPTRNRLSLVKDALVTLRAQDYDNWNCIVYDNGSNEPVVDYVASLNDSRVKCVRSDAFAPVTESWNGAIDCATGDYVILTGDDDGFPPGALSKIADIVHEFDRPEFIYTSLIQFIHPMVRLDEPWGYVDKVSNGFFFHQATRPFVLDAEVAKLSVLGSLNFRRSFTYNMQACIFSKRLLGRMRRDGKIFHSPFPDYYIANVALLESKKTVVVPEPLGIQGVSRKSFGFTLFNNLPDVGAALLATDLQQDRHYSNVADQILAGPPYNTNFMITMHHVVEALGAASPSAVNMKRYRRVQIVNAINLDEEAERAGSPSDKFAKLAKDLSEEEIGWANTLRRGLGVTQTNADERAIANSIRDNASMYAPFNLAVQMQRIATGQFALLPEVYVALRTGRICV